jgi:hypothetical protein
MAAPQRANVGVTAFQKESLALGKCPSEARWKQPETREKCGGEWI